MTAILAVIGATPLMAQQTGGLPALEKRVATLETTVNVLMQTNASQAAAITALQNRLAAVESKLAFVSTSGIDMYISGANLHIINGLGATNGYPTDPDSRDPAQVQVNGPSSSGTTSIPDSVCVPAHTT